MSQETASANGVHNAKKELPITFANKHQQGNPSYFSDPASESSEFQNPHSNSKTKKTLSRQQAQISLDTMPNPNIPHSRETRDPFFSASFIF